MKKRLQNLAYALFLVLMANQLVGQTITYDLRCSSDGSRYELFVTRDTEPSTPFTAIGSSRITLVLPTGSQTVSITNESNAINYSALPIIRDPGSNGNDYFGFSTSGGQTLIGELTANQPELWMTFTPSGDINQDARLFINGTDPQATDPGMGGVDLQNSFFVLSIAGSNNEYVGNVSDAPINCGSVLSNSSADFTQLSISPNPTTGILNIRGVNNLRGIEVYNINGQFVKRFDINLQQIDISEVQAGVYFVNIETEQASKRIKIVKQ